MTDLRHARANLSVYPHAYQRGLDLIAWAEASPPYRSPFANVESLIELDRRGIPVESGVLTRKPASPNQPTPRKGDPRLRATLIASTQALLAAVGELAVWDWETALWNPGTIWRDGEPVLTEQFAVDCDPDDLSTRTLTFAEVQTGARQLAGLYSLLETADLDEDDETTVACSVRLADRAVGRLIGLGVWTVPVAAEIRLCRRAGCIDRDTGLPRVVTDDRKTCGACRAKDHRTRKANA